MKIFTYSASIQGVIVLSGRGVKYHLWTGPLETMWAQAGRLAPGAAKGLPPAGLLRDLEDYFSGRPVELADWPVYFDGLSSFCADVYQAVRRLRWGQTATYAGIARDIGRPLAARAVGTALARNPVPLFVPCHRVVAAVGAGGWTGPAGLKTQLLELEAAKWVEGRG